MALPTGLEICRPSKGIRYTFSVKLDPEHAAKLVEILRTLSTNGVDYLTPVVIAHLNSVDVGLLHNNSRGLVTAVADHSAAPSSPQGMKRKRTEEGKLRWAQVLAPKINLLLDAIVDESGQPYSYPAIEAGTKKAGHYVSRTRWSQLINGKGQVIPEASLRAIATVFGVNPEYLLDENAPLPPEVEAALPRVRVKRLSDIREFAVRSLEAIDPERLSAITELLDDAIES